NPFMTPLKTPPGQAQKSPETYTRPPPPAEPPQLGNLLGCVLGITRRLTGITIVAIGTSLPDTFASRTAALQDEYADNSAVNVFLGPRPAGGAIATIYAAAKSAQVLLTLTRSQSFQSLVFFLTVATVCILIALFAET
uniref:Na_Ca_ex domain-containing protein n=1 Tax=Macrostomum lignano TaxID=282301 RepID=A0A1I8FJZ5_9PLAT